MIKKPKSLKTHCASCGGERNCSVKGLHKNSGGNIDITYWKYWYILQCKGCDYIFFYTVYGDSESYEHQYNDFGEPITVGVDVVEYFPAILSRIKPNWLDEIVIDDFNKAQLFFDTTRELYGACNADLNMLTTVGIRTAFDVISEIIGINTTLPFTEKIAQLTSKTNLSDSDLELINQLVEAGHASVHRGWKPSKKQLNTLMDVFEHFAEKMLMEPKRKDVLKLEMNHFKGSIPTKQIRTKLPKNKLPDETK